MKRNLTFVLATIVTLVTFSPFTSFSQYAPSVTAGFGIDGDVLSGQSLNASTTPASSFDWFKTPGTAAGVGIGIIDTTGSAVYRSQLMAGQNIGFNQGMAFPRFSTQNGYLHLDARYGRDRIGGSSSNGDLTTFTSGSKNGDNPATWITTPAGATVADKADIIDSYIHMRRNGTTINNTNPSTLVLAMGVSTIGNTGNRYVDFELFRTRIAYNSSTGAFSNSGDVATGGHSAWVFNSNGTVNTIGDMTVSFSYSTAGVSEVGIYLWVSNITYNTLIPSRFGFVPNEFYGSSFGYAKIAALNAGQFNVWASASTGNTPGPSWGTASKSLNNASMSYSTQYAAYDFGEVAIDLTSMGVDPAFAPGGFDVCVPTFSRVITKTRSSSSFTSALQDFSGPYEFLDAPEAPPAISTPGVLKCNVSNITLSPVTYVSGASYQWSTSNGNIVSTTGSNASVDKVGKYYLTTTIITGCPTKTDSTVVLEDKFKPVASATVVGALISNNPLSTALLVGGDVTLSNVITVFGGSTGLNWNWKGPGTFTSSTKDAVINQPGTYTLILTEQRNGCADTAVVPVVAIAGPLPVKYLSLNAVPVENSAVAITWVTTEEINNNRFEVERSFDVNTFKTIAIVLDGIAAGTQKNYAYTDRSADLQIRNVVYYRLKQFDNDGRFTYSKILTVKLKMDAAVVMEVSPNPFAQSINVRYNATQKGLAQISIVNAAGKIVMVHQTNINVGNNNISINNLGNLNAGLYIARLTINGGVVATEKIIRR